MHRVVSASLLDSDAVVHPLLDAAKALGALGDSLVAAYAVLTGDEALSWTLSLYHGRVPCFAAAPIAVVGPGAGAAGGRSRLTPPRRLVVRPRRRDAEPALFKTSPASCAEHAGLEASYVWLALEETARREGARPRRRKRRRGLPPHSARKPTPSLRQNRPQVGAMYQGPL